MTWPFNSKKTSAEGSSATQELSPAQALTFTAIKSLLSLLKEALRALTPEDESKDPSQVQELKTVDELREQFEPARLEDDKQRPRLEKQLRRDCAELSAFVARQREAALTREKELADVVQLLSKSVAEATRNNATFYRDIRAEGERIAEASHIDDLQRLKAALRVAAEKLDSLVTKQERHDQSRIDALSLQVNALKTELAQARATAQTDSLTGALNRRSFDESIGDLVRRYQGTRHSFSLLLFDIDDFKRINDRFGHPVGDRVIMAFAQRCQSLLRPGDQLARYGGEEFAVLLDAVSLRNATKRAAGICEAVAGARYAISKERDADPITVTVSAGVAAFRRHDTAEDLIERADKALYLAKERGKNRALSEKELGS